MSRFQHTLANLLARRAPSRMPSILSTLDGSRHSGRASPAPPGPNAHPAWNNTPVTADAAGGCPFAKQAQSSNSGSASASTSKCPVSGRFAPTTPPPAELDSSAVPEPAVARAPAELEQLWNEPAASVLYIPPLLSRLPPTPTLGPTADPSSGLPDSSVSWTDSHLPSIDPASARLHSALRHFRPVTNAYAFVPYAAAFNWGQLDLGPDAQREWYVVAFRSLRSPAADPELLGRADRLAHEEAVGNGGLLGYWYGNATSNEKGANLATCIWMSRAHALAANTGERHQEAVALARVSACDRCACLSGTAAELCFSILRLADQLHDVCTRAIRAAQGEGCQACDGA